MASETQQLQNWILSALTYNDVSIRLPLLERLEELSIKSPEEFNEETINLFFLNLNVHNNIRSEINVIKRIFMNISKNNDLNVISDSALKIGYNLTTLEILFCITQLLNDKKQEICVPKLVDFILAENYNNDDYNCYKTNLLYCNRNILLYFLFQNINLMDNKLYKIVDILSNIYNEKITESFIKIYKRILDGEKYGDKYVLIQWLLLNYFVKHHIINSYKLLLETFYVKDSNLINSDYFKDAIVELFDNNFDIFFKYLKEYKNDSNKFGIVIAILNKMENNKLKQVDTRKILNIIHTNKTHFEARYLSIILFSKLSKNVKHVLKELYHGSKEEYEFAREIILLRSESIYDYDKCNPIISISEIILNELQYSYIKENRNISQLLKSDLKNFRKKDIKLQIQRFEYLIASLLTSAKFITFFVDFEDTKGIDIIAISPHTDAVLLIGCTTALITNDDKKLLDALNILKRKGLKINYIPVIAISYNKSEISIYDEIMKEGIILLTIDKIYNLYEMIESNRPHIEILENICKVPINLPK